MADRVIDVFLLFDPGDRNTYTWTSEGKSYSKVLPGPDWVGMASDAAKLGFKVNVSGPSFQLTAAGFTASLKNSEGTILIGHGHGSVVGKKWITSKLFLSDGMIYAPDGMYEGTWTGMTLTPSKDHPKASRVTTNKVTGVFTCNSHDVLPKAFDIGKDSVMITNDGGGDGFTRVGTLENTGFAFVQTYVSSKGDLQKAVAKAQAVLKASGEKFAGDKGDTLNVEK